MVIGDDTQKENSSFAFASPPPMNDPGGMSAGVQRSINLDRVDTPGRTASIVPPPGFDGGAPPGLSIQIGQTLAGSTTLPGNFPTGGSVLGQLMQKRTADALSPMLFDVPNTLQTSYPMGSGGGDFSYGWKSNGHGLTVAESFHLFGDMQTANPFAPTYSVSNNSSASYQNPLGGFTNGGDDGDDDAKYLNTGLLNSLFGEVDTNNPWAAK
jgi:hypothetical protein